MQFLFPSFLWALTAVSIPILIHLFHFRRFRKVYFPNVKFLKEIKEETSNRNRLKNILVLIARILAVVALVLAFAQPFIPQSDEVVKGSRAVSVFIDNSFSMSAVGEDIALLDKAKIDAANVISAYDNADVFQVITHDFQYFQQKWLNKEEALEQIESIVITHDVKLFSQILRRQYLALSESKPENHVIYWVSDFQKSITDTDEIQLDSNIQYNLIHLTSVQNSNLSIDSCWWVAPIPIKGQQGSLIVSVHNYGTQEVEDLTINLNYNKQNYPVAKINVPGKQRVIDTLRFTLNQGGWNEALVSIKDYPVRFDDEYWIAFEVSETIPVLVINENRENKYTRAVFESAEIFELDYYSLSKIDYSSLSKYKLVVLEDIGIISSGLLTTLLEYMENGGNLILFPSATADIASLNNLMLKANANKISGKETNDMQVGRINQNEFVFKGVFEKLDPNISLPTAKMRFLTAKNTRSNNRQVLAFRDGRSFIDAYEIGEGHLYFSTVPLNVNVNDLVKQAEIFVPMLYRMALSSNISDNISHTIGKDQQIKVKRQVRSSEIPFKIKGENEFIPGIRNIGPMAFLDVRDQVDKSGIYAVILEQDTIKRLAFNYDRRESDLNCYTADQVKKLIGDELNIYESSASNVDLSESIVAREKGILLWKWFIILALMFFAAEVLLLRLLRI